MVRQNIVRKWIIVVFLTVLIWVWTDLAQDEDLELSRIPITISEAEDPSLWINFVGPDGLGVKSQVIDTIELTVPVSRISDTEKLARELELIVVPKEEGFTNEGKTLWPLLPFLKKNQAINQLGLTVEKCEPESLQINVLPLVKKPLAVQCLDSNGELLQGVQVEPSQIDMFVPKDWSGEKLAATVVLTPNEEDLARSAAVDKLPQITIEGQVKLATQPVGVRLAGEDELLKREIIQNVKFGLLLSPAIQKNYRVVIKDDYNLNEQIEIRATEEAKLAYESQPYHVMLVIENVEEGMQNQDLVYNFPEKSVRSKEIKLYQTPQRVYFELVPLDLTEGTTGGD